jgi:hypothetical protein
MPADQPSTGAEEADNGMTPRRGLTKGIAATGASVILAGCSVGASASRPDPSGAAARPTVSSIKSALVGTISSATGMHVSGTYIISKHKWRVSLNLLTTGQMAGTIIFDNTPAVVIKAGDKVYEKVTPRLLRIAHKVAACPAICGKYVAFPTSGAAEIIRDIGITTTISMLSTVANGFSTFKITTYHGKRAYRLPVSGMAPGATAVVAATAGCEPLAVNDPGLVEVTFSRWNHVSVPVTPTPSQIVPNALSAPL